MQFEVGKVDARDVKQGGVLEPGSIVQQVVKSTLDIRK